MNSIFWPRINYVLRHLMRPIAPALHHDWHPRVAGTIDVALDEERTIKLDCNPTSFMAKILFFQGIEGYEYETFRVFRGLAKHASLFFDVGANIGYFSLVAAAYNPALRVASFEPLPGAFEYLKRNVRLNDSTHVQPFNRALSDQRGSATFSFTINPTFVEVEHHLTSTGGLAHSGDEQGMVKSFEVQTDTLDHIAHTQFEGERVDLIKLDVEGAEDRVLRGGTQVLSKHGPIVVCEVLPEIDEENLEQMFRAHDYRVFRIGREGIHWVDHLTARGTEVRNRLMVPADRASEIEMLLSREMKRAGSSTNP